MAKEPKSTLKFAECIGSIEQGKIAPIYFVSGSEDYLKTELTGALRQQLFGKNPRDANFERFSVRAGKASDLLNTVMEYSLFGGGKLVVVQDGQKFNKADKDLLVTTLPQVPPENHLVIFHDGPMDMRLKYFKYVTQKTEWLSLLPLTQNTARFWIDRQLSRYNLRIDSAALEFLIDFAGLSYSTISEEIEKLSLNVEPGSTVTVDDIQNYGSRSAVFSIFELTDALGRKDREKALNRLSRLMESGENPQVVLGRILKHFNYLVMIDALRDLKSPQMISSRIGVQPFFINKCREQIAGFSRNSLLKSLRYIFEAEYQSRFEKMPRTYILENLIVKITSL